MAREQDPFLVGSTRLGAAIRSNPLNNSREPKMGVLAAVPLVALVIFGAVAWFSHARVEAHRMQAVAQAVVANGHAAPVEVTPIRGGECGRAREGFAWKTAGATGWACAGPGSEVRLKAETPVEPRSGP